MLSISSDLTVTLSAKVLEMTAWDTSPVIPSTAAAEYASRDTKTSLLIARSVSHWMAAVGLKSTDSCHDVLC